MAVSGRGQGALFEAEAPLVAGLVSKAFGGAEEPQALDPALVSGGANREALEGVDGDEPAALFESDAQGVVPAVLVAGGSRLDGADHGLVMWGGSGPCAGVVNGRVRVPCVDRLSRLEPERAGGCRRCGGWIAHVRVENACMAFEELEAVSGVESPDRRTGRGAHRPVGRFDGETEALVVLGHERGEAENAYGIIPAG
jgi:hypothetical protein